MRWTFALWSLFAYRLAASFEIPTSSSYRTSRESPSCGTTLLPMTSSPSSNPPIPELKVLGICGGIGSGKSTAAKLLVSDCACLVHLDADSLAHSVYSPGSPAVHDIVDAFGSQVLAVPNNHNNNNNNNDDETKGRVEEEGTLLEIDRKKLGAIVFSNRKDMAKLEQLVWPHVKNLLMEKIAQVKSQWQQQQQQQTTDTSMPVVVLEAAVLLDAEWEDILDGIWVVRAPRHVALQRLMETRNLSQDESNQRIDAQESRRGIRNLQEELDKGIVTQVIDNSNNSLEDLKKALHQALLDPKSWKTNSKER